MALKNIIFDFGGVILDIDYTKTFDQLHKIMEIDIAYGNIPESLVSVFDDFEKGLLNEETFLWKIQKASKNPPHPRAIIDAWNAMLLGWNPERFNMLLELQKNYNVYLLSNTNSIHLSWAYKDLAEKYDIDNWDKKYFDQTFYSHLMGMRKPDADIYQEVLRQANIKAEETIFIDDNEENIKTADSLGIGAFLHDPATEITSKIKQYVSAFS